MREFKLGDIKYELNEALIDTGTSLIVLPSSIYSKMDEDYFSKLCLPHFSTIDTNLRDRPSQVQVSFGSSLPEHVDPEQWGFFLNNPSDVHDGGAQEHQLCVGD